MKITVGVINFIKARELNSRLFRLLCKENDAEFDRLLLYNSVRWLSRGRSLERVVILRKEIHQFLAGKNHEHAATFNDPQYLAGLSLLTDVFGHLNKLNLELQGKEKLVFDLNSSIKRFIHSW